MHLVAYFAFKVFVPKEDSKIFRYYKNLLKYTRVRVKTFLILKAILVSISILIFCLIKMTNVSIYTNKIFNTYEYKVDLIYSEVNKNINEEKSLKEETFYLEKILKEIDKVDFKKLDKDYIQNKIMTSIKEDNTNTELSEIILANKVYNRLKDYYRVRDISFKLLIIIVFLVYFIPDLIILIKSKFTKGSAKRELSFLKKMIIINGSIKPVSFDEVLSILIEKSNFYRPLLIKIRNMNSKNNLDKKDIYTILLSDIKDFDEKLFLEKLDQAHNYNFDQAIVNIKNEFRIDIRQRSRKVKKRIEGISLMGLIGSMLVIFLITIYLLMPWLEMYNLNSII